MAAIKWDESSKRYYETGTSHGVLFPLGADGKYEKGVPWNGLISVKQSPDGAESKPIYANNNKYISMTSAENFKGSISAYTYPEEFAACDGSKALVPGIYLGQQSRKPFGLVYSTIVGNDTEGIDYGEKMHFIYEAKVAPSSRDYSTVNEDPEAIEFSWEFSTTPAEVSENLQHRGFKKTAYVCIDCTKLKSEDVKKIKDSVYGETGEPKMPSIDELLKITGIILPPLDGNN
ncbi:Uncharacterised protein [Chlamydia trachomatis]|nr:Uncharacterised protein [Chlamydia trachomatis]